MKPIIIYVCVLVFTLAAGAAGAQEFDFQRSGDFKKLDGRARSAWVDAMRAGDEKRELKCMLKVAGKMDQRQKNDLARAGFKPGTIIQTIVTGSVAVGKVPSVAKLHFVKVLELAVPLGIKKDPAYRKYGTPSRRVKVTPKKKTTKKVKAAEKPAMEAGTLETVEKAEKEQLSKPFSDSPNTPMYQSESEAVRPNQPPTSPEIPSDEPAIAPVDQGNIVVQPKPTLTQPITEKPKPEPVPQPMPQAAPEEKPTYAPSQ